MKISTPKRGEVSIMAVGVFNVYWTTSEQIVKSVQRSGVSIQ